MRLRDGEGHMWMWDSGMWTMNWGMMIFMMIFWIIVIGLVIYGIILLMKGNSRNNSDKTDNQSMNILKERLAKGELTEDEYREKKNLLLEK